MSVILENEKGKVLEFFNALEEMIEGKFILSDIKISKILKSIAGCETLYNLFSKCLVDFNFREELENSIQSTMTNGCLIQLPEDAKKQIAYVFHLFVEVDNKKLNFQNFINEYFFNEEGYNYSYSNFSKNILLPFKSAVIEQLDIDDLEKELKNCDEGEENMEDEEFDDDGIKMQFSKLMVSISDLYSEVLKDNKIKTEQKEEIYIIVSAINEAVRIQNIKIVNALIIPLQYLLKKNKRVRPYFNVVQDDLCELYESYQ